MSSGEDQKKRFVSDVIDNGEYGSLLYSPEFEEAPKVLPPEALHGTVEPLPVRVTLENLPAISMQGMPLSLGTPGSCEAQSFGYCLGSYTAARNPDGSAKWDPSQPAYQISAAFLYNFVHSQEKKQCPKGSQALPYLNHLIAYGAPSAYDIPYYPVCCYLSEITLTPNFPNMTQFRLGSLAAFSISADLAAALVLIKKLLAAGNAVAFSGRVLKNYATPALDDGILCVTDFIPNSGHGQVVVGYDDKIGPPGNPGALLIQNSFGTGWPAIPNTSKAPQGRLYWSYESFMETQSLAATAYPLNTGPLTGLALSTTGKPDATVNKAYQWAPMSGDGVCLIAMLQFGGPVKLTGVEFTEPSTGTKVTGGYGAYINNGYVYMKRTDGNQFVPGSWGISLGAEDLDGTTVSYEGMLTVTSAQPASPVAAVVTTSTSITDTTGAAAKITLSPS
jgi:hypothetical protein